MSFNSVQKSFGWSPDHLTEAMTDPSIQQDVMQGTGRDIVQEALSPSASPSIQGLQSAAGIATNVGANALASNALLNPKQKAAF